MLKFGKAPFLECSSAGDKRFSAFYARLRKYGGKSIEVLYQEAKVFEGGVTRLSWREAKGKTPINIKELTVYYARLWDQYFKENPKLLDVIKKYNGFTDRYGQKGHNCQAKEILRIKKEYFDI